MQAVIFCPFNFQIRRSPSIHVRITECCIQTVLGRPRELHFLDRDFGLLASSRDPNFTGRQLFWLGLRVGGILQTFYSQAAIPRTIDVSPGFLEHSSEEKITV
jgi:hypothetical protein